MNGKLMAGALAAALWGWGGVALAQQAQPQYNTVPNPELRGSTIQDNQAGAVAQTPESSSELNVNVEPARPIVVKPNDNPNHVRGVSLSAGAGVEGYSGVLAPEVRAGPAWNVNLSLRPTKVLGFELGYSGATNEINIPGGGYGLVAGPDIVRNGGRGLVTLGLTASPVQPYILGGYGLDHYNVNAAAVGFHSANVSDVPVGAGLRAFIHGFTADARFDYAFLINSTTFSNAMASTTIAGTPVSNAGRYQGILSIGGNF